MLDPRYVAENLESVRAALARRSSEAASAVDELAELVAQRRQLVAQTESLKARRNAANQEMSRLAKGPDKAAFAARRDELKELSGQVKELEEQLAAVEGELKERLLGVPNLPDESAPTGQSEADNPVVRSWGERREFDFEPKPHWDLGVELGVLDFERAAKLSGARFAVLLGAAARLERALIGFMLDLHTREHGYLEVLPPFLVRGSTMQGTGQLPKFEDDLFKTRRSDPDDPGALYLIPTAEVPLTNLHADEILDAERLPLAYTAYTPCFRAEAGAYGKDTRGLIRQHQFDKVELVRFVTPESAAEQLELLTSHAEAVLQRLRLAYRVVELCTADLGFSAARTYDLEVWVPSQGAYREISSCSTCGDFQARRAKIRYRAEPKAKPRLLHTQNGSGLAVGRTMIAILEQYQQKDGSVIVPEALRPYLGQDVITPER